MSIKTLPTEESTATRRRDVDPEPVDDVRYLAVGDRVRLDGRARPLVVTGTATRTVETPDDDRNTIQHAVELEGDWEGARTYVVANAVDFWHGIELDEQRLFESGDRVDLELVAMADSRWRAE